MIGEKTVAYQGKGTNLDDLAQKISGYLQGEGFKVQSSPSSPEGNVIQARKGGFLDELIAADRALSIVTRAAPTSSPCGSGSASGSTTSPPH